MSTPDPSLAEPGFRAMRVPVYQFGEAGTLDLLTVLHVYGGSIAAAVEGLHPGQSCEVQAADAGGFTMYRVTRLGRA